MCIIELFHLAYSKLSLDIISLDVKLNWGKWMDTFLQG